MKQLGGKSITFFMTFTLFFYRCLTTSYLKLLKVLVLSSLYKAFNLVFVEIIFFIFTLTFHPFIVICNYILS